MKFDVIGEGIIPGLDLPAPQYEIPLEKSVVKHLINYKNFRVYCRDGIVGLVTKKNIHDVFCCCENPAISCGTGDSSGSSSTIDVGELAPVKFYKPNTTYKTGYMLYAFNSLYVIMKDFRTSSDISEETLKTSVDHGNLNYVQLML